MGHSLIVARTHLAERDFAIQITRGAAGMTIVDGTHTERG
jgi:hypothetical protein